MAPKTAPQTLLFKQSVSLCITSYLEEVILRSLFYFSFNILRGYHIGCNMLAKN